MQPTNDKQKARKKRAPSSCQQQEEAANIDMHAATRSRREHWPPARKETPRPKRGRLKQCMCMHPPDTRKRHGDCAYVLPTRQGQQREEPAQHAWSRGVVRSLRMKKSAGAKNGTTPFVRSVRFFTLRKIQILGFPPSKRTRLQRRQMISYVP